MDSRSRNPLTGSLPPVVQLLLIANGGVFVLQLLGAFEPLVELFALWPPGNEGRAPPFQLWQLVSYAFLHGSPAHLFFNMFALWMFGRQIEGLWGSVHFVVYYFVCVIGAALVQLLVVSGPYPTIGASGGVFGILLAYGMMFPNHTVLLIFPPIPLKAKYFVILYGVLELWLGVTAPRGGIAHFAHLGGMLFGYLLILYWRGRLPWKPKYTLRR